jgi:hypothetical protein
MLFGLVLKDEFCFLGGLMPFIPVEVEIEVEEVEIEEVEVEVRQCLGGLKSKPRK